MVCDRGFPLRQLQARGMQRSGARGPGNLTARRAALAPSPGQGRRPPRGALVRPLPRPDKNRLIAATPPARQAIWQLPARPAPVQLTAPFWDGVVLAEAPPGAPPFRTVRIHAPRFAAPWLLHTALPLTGAQ